MWKITLRDLEFRRRQFGIAVVGAGLVFALTLVLTGMSAGFYSEAHATIDSVGADAWVVPNGVSGPFTGLSVVDPSTASGVQGANRVDPLVIAQATVEKGAGVRGVNLIGHVAGGLGVPKAEEGRIPTRSGEIMVDDGLGFGIGKHIVLGGVPFTVVGKVSGKTYFAGVPIAYSMLEDAQKVGFAGRPLATAFVTTGRPTSVPAGMQVMSNVTVFKDLTRPTSSARQTIASTRAFMWLVGVVIIGAVTYLSALERVRDFAVLKAVGGAPRTLLASIGSQAILASLLAAVLAMLLAQVLMMLPAFALPITITATAYLILPVVAVGIGVLASLAAIRRAVRVDPALAFG